MAAPVSFHSIDLHWGTSTDVTLKEDKADSEAEPTGPLPFVESTWFQSLVGFVIFCNAIMMGVEMEVASSAWTLVEFAVLLFFVVELCMRWCHYGWRFLTTAGNIFDMLIVMSGAIEMWVVPVLQWLVGGRQRHRHSSALLFAVQTLRLGRIVRLVRLVKIVQPLYRLALGIAEALQGMFWVLVFLAMMLYAGAIICTRLLGESEGIRDSGEEDVAEDIGSGETRELFHSVFASMFALFEMMSCWSLIKLTPLFRQLPILRLLFVLFYILMAWALLAVMTGVVSEKLIAVRDQVVQEEEDREQARRMSMRGKLMELFSRVDVDESGTVTKEEFDFMLTCPDVSKLLLDYTQVSAEELTDVFNWLDRDKNGSVDVSEWIESFSWLNEQVSPKSLLKLQEEASRKVRQLERGLVAFVHERFDSLIANVGQPVRKINAMAEQILRINVAVESMQASVEALPKETNLVEDEVPRAVAELAGLEERLSQRLEQLLEAVCRLEGLLEARS